VLDAKLRDVKREMAAAGIDGWLLFDFRGSNPYAGRVVSPGNGLLTRRWFVWVPTEGTTEVLLHSIEVGSFPNGEYELSSYAGRESLRDELRRILHGAKRVAMEYSPFGNNPYVSKVDGGTLELVRSLGVEVVSSGDLCQMLLAWSPQQLDNHRRASNMLTRTRDTALELLRARSAAGEPINEYEVQQRMLDLIESSGFEAGHAPIVGFGPGAGDPHYSPSAVSSRTLQEGDAVLLDLWCKVPGDNPHADITWMAHHGAPTEEFMRAFNTVTAARDAGLDLLRERLERRQPVRGHEVDTCVRDVLINAGYEANLKHRTGHSLGNWAVHGDGAHFDAFETLDERLVLPGLGTTIEPGVYFPHFGVRSEINVYIASDGVELTTARQTELDLV